MDTDGISVEIRQKRPVETSNIKWCGQNQAPVAMLKTQQFMATWPRLTSNAGFVNREELLVSENFWKEYDGIYWLSKVLGIVL